MSSSFIIFMRFLLIAIHIICVLLHLGSSSARSLQQQSKNGSSRELGEFSGCGNGNPIDDCWRCDPNWADPKNRQKYADCAIGFGKNAIGGKEGEIYVVTSTEDDPTNPKRGTLRHAVIQDEPLWIVFKHKHMSFSFKEELIMSASSKTIDGRGSNVEIVGPACISVQYVHSVIISNLVVRDCVPTLRVGFVGVTDGDGISIFQSSGVWVDHCTLSNCADGLIDAVESSTDITVSNSHFSHHNEVMLLGHNDAYTDDKNMRVTVVFNHFGEELKQRMPRCRLGLFHVMYNVYTKWEMYAIGGSANPTILSMGNKFIADPDNPRTHEVTKRLNCETEQEYNSWNWMSDKDIMENGAYFKTSGSSWIHDYYRMAESLAVGHGSNIDALTADAGVLNCYEGTACST